MSKTKIDRVAVHAKYDGRCAYCGYKIGINQMHVDHIVPRRNAYLEPGLDNDRIENLNPSCGPCNNFKSTFPLDSKVGPSFRKELVRQVSRLLVRSSQFRRAHQFGLIQITGEPVRFYFEGGQR